MAMTTFTRPSVDGIIPIDIPSMELSPNGGTSYKSSWWLYTISVYRSHSFTPSRVNLHELPAKFPHLALHSLAREKSGFSSILKLLNTKWTYGRLQNMYVWLKLSNNSWKCSPILLQMKLYNVWTPFISWFLNPVYIYRSYKFYES